jgi:hypothetical protein
MEFDAVVVVISNVLLDVFSKFLDAVVFVQIEEFGFNNTKEVFDHSVIQQVPFLDMLCRIPFFSAYFNIASFGIVGPDRNAELAWRPYPCF